jgi:LEA14-like dessication related protein
MSDSTDEPTELGGGGDGGAPSAPDGSGDGGGSAPEGGDDGEGSTLARAVKALALGLSGLVLLVVLLFVLGVLGLPDTQLEDNRWGDVEGQEVGVTTEVGVDNPNPFGFGGEADVTYDVFLEGVRLAEGEGDDLEVDAGYNSYNFSSTLFAENITPWWSRHLRNGEVSKLEADTTADVRLGPLSGTHDTVIEDEIETDIEGALDQSSDEFEGEYSLTRTGLSLEPSLRIENATTEWGEVTNETTEIVTTITIANNNPYPIPTPAFAGSIVMNEELLVGWTASEVRVLGGGGEEIVGEKALIPPNEVETRSFVAEMNNQNISTWFPTHVDSQQPTDGGVELTDMVVTGQLAFQVNGERFTIPPGDQAVECEFDLTTSIFVNQTSGVTTPGCGLTEFTQSEEELQDSNSTIDVDPADGGVIP